MKVLKFGGTSMANADCILRVKGIIESDSDARYIVVSAPGKREDTDLKVTDLLYACYNERQEKGTCDDAFVAIKDRFNDIISKLNLSLNLEKYYNEIINDINHGASRDYTASRGEYLAAIVMAALLNVPFVDASELIRFDMDGNFLPELTNKICEKAFAKFSKAVIPGFYGQMPNGRIKTFSRGGSDITGSIIARSVNASVYENWTDVDGFLAGDPRIIKNPSLISMLTYKELRELSYMGANVLHSDSIFPVRKNNIPINIKNTFNPSALGTMIVPTSMFLSRQFSREDKTVTGVAGRKGFVAIYIEKSLMNNEVGYAKRILNILERHNVLMEHMPSGIDTITLIIDGAYLCENTLKKLVESIECECSPDHIQVHEKLALIAVVGHGMSRKKGTAARLFKALANANVNVRMIDQGSSELNTIVGVEDEDYEVSIRALYEEFKNN